jgi:hypothetical protein
MIDVHALTMAANAVIQETNRLTSALEGLPATAGELRAMLDELADADADCSAHFKRFASEKDLKQDEQSKENNDDWSRCYYRREHAIGAIKKYATATRTVQAEVPATLPTGTPIDTAMGEGRG